jgi:uncharacterized protein (DUF934 family)
LALLRNGRVETDSFTDVSNDDSIPAAGSIIVSLVQWRDHRDALTAREEPLGIVLHSDEKPESIADDIERFAVIALDFPAFRDGRAYSYARLLRDRYNYQGELRAVGDVLLEQLHFMHRVGFNSFQIESDDAAKAWAVAAADINVWYQTTGDGRNSVIRLRHRQRSE